MSSWQLRRARGPASVLLCLALGIVGIDVAVAGISGWDSFGAGERRQSYHRTELASANALALRQASVAGVQVGLVVGMSTADWGIDLRRLEGDGAGLRWAKITGEFSSFTNLLEVVRPIDDAGLAPTQTLLCIHYGMLLGGRRYKSEWRTRLSQIAERTRQTHSKSELFRAVTLSWAGNNRTTAANALELDLGALRERVLLGSGQRPESVYVPVSDPFVDSVNEHGPMHPSARERHVQGFKELWRHAQDAKNPDTTAQADALVEIVTRLGRHGRLVVVLMPEHSTLRAAEPEQFAAELLQRTLQRASLPEALRMLDLRSALPDQYFADEVHATKAGRPVLTDALQEGLAEPLLTLPSH